MLVDVAAVVNVDGLDEADGGLLAHLSALQQREVGLHLVAAHSQKLALDETIT